MLGTFNERGYGGLVTFINEARHLYKLSAASGYPRAVDALRLLDLSPTCFTLFSAGTVPVPAMAPVAPAAANDHAELAAVNIRAELAAVDLWGNGPLAANIAAAERGDAAAQWAMALRYEKGDRSVPHYNAEATRLYRKSADQGFANAQAALGRTYVLGRGVPQSFSDAARWYKLAAAQDHHGAERRLRLARFTSTAMAASTLTSTKLGAFTCGHPSLATLTPPGCSAA